MRSFVQVTQDDCDRITRRAARAKTKGELTQEQMNQIISCMADLEDLLEKVENGE